MDRSQAETIVATVQAYFPRPELPDSTVRAWADELEPYDFGDAQEAARRMSRELRYPVLAEMIGLLDEVRRERMAAETPRPALPASEAEVVAGMPDDVRERWHALQATWAGTEERDTAAEDAEWQRRKTASLAGLRMEGTCLGTDKPPVLVDGRLVCPVCQIEVVDPRKAGRT